MNDLNFNFAEMLEEMKTDNEGNSRKSYFFPSEAGTYIIRLLPPLQGEKLFYNKRRIHWLTGSSINCVNQELIDKNGNLHSAEPCAACDLSRRLFKTSEEKTPERELAYEIRGQLRYLFRVIVRGDNELEPLFYESGKTIYDLIYDTLTNPEWGNILSPLSGRDFRLVKTGSGKKSKYDKSGPSANPTPIYEDKEKIKELLLESAPKLNYSSAVEFLTGKEIANLVRRHCSDGSEPERRPVGYRAPEKQVTSPISEDDNNVINADAEEYDEVTELLNQFN